MDSKIFVDKNSTLDTYWRSIILLGRNVASYKFALARSLLELDNNSSEISLDEIALPFAINICAHLKTGDKQITSSSSQFLDYCKDFNRDEITEDELKKQTLKLGFKNVIDAFHNVSHSEVPRFFEDNRKASNSIVLTDNFYQLINIDKYQNLTHEVDARWSLWETAISLKINPHALEISADKNSEVLYVLNKEKRRFPITSSKYALNGYQKGRCFYCAIDISIQSGNENSCEVDHFFPETLKNYDFNHPQLNEIWNLVLSCRNCNRGIGGKFDRIADIKFLYSLNNRNNFYIESHHPLRETILNQTGKSADSRVTFLQDFFDQAVSKIPSINKWKPLELYGEQL